MKSRTRRTTLLIVIVLFCISAGNFALAQQDQIISAYKQFIDITAPNIIVPTVVNVPFASISVDRPEFAVLNQSQNTFEPHYFKHTRGSAIPISISSNSYAGNHQAMIDNQPRTFTEFALPEELEGTAVITVQASQRIESSELKLMLDDHVALPSFIEIRANSADLQQIVVAKTRLNSTTVQFPKTSAQTWVIQLTYIQPLRVNELQLRQENQGIPEQAVRFLAQPNMSYRIYFNPDRFAAPNVGESADLVNDQDVLALQATTSQKNPLYIPADIDSDGIPDRLDSCVSVTNQDQVDINQIYIYLVLVCFGDTAVETIGDAIRVDIRGDLQWVFF